ncbi:hypothetical protein, partial [Lentilactobacillus sp. Marseille-Q4993]|uniref:hypothetical protein n=1 Tax=Lentilactobacillus sp. Marseille-Q4993 TaxID=3039492 RepID=UPI0024BD152C
GFRRFKNSRVEFSVLHRIQKSFGKINFRSFFALAGTYVPASFILGWDCNQVVLYQSRLFGYG